MKEITHEATIKLEIRDNNSKESFAVYFLDPLINDDEFEEGLVIEMIKAAFKETDSIVIEKKNRKIEAPGNGLPKCTHCYKDFTEGHAEDCIQKHIILPAE